MRNSLRCLFLLTASLLTNSSLCAQTAAYGCGEIKQDLFDFVLFNHRLLAIDLMVYRGDYLDSLISILDRCHDKKDTGESRLRQLYLDSRHPTTFAHRLLEFSSNLDQRRD